jgi:hypothetical protein
MLRPRPPFIDARTWTALEKRTALVRLDDAVIMFTSSLVLRAEGTYRHKHAVNLFVPSEHRKQPFDEVRSVTLYLTGDRQPLTTDDIEREVSRDVGGVTLVLCIDIVQ